MKFLKRRKPEPEKHYLMFPTEPPLPPCPVHGDRCGTVFFDNKWFPTYQPCEALEAEIKRHQYNQTHEYFWDPQSGDFVAHPR
jgi:hypothetical protein